LLELYTSEGCSSCPPADDWFSTLKDQPGLWKGFVPVAFHVDYWNYLGWTGPYSKSEFTQRQRRYASLWSSDTIYTPGFVLDGREWRRRSARDLIRPDDREVGRLKLEWKSGRFSIGFEPSMGTPEKWSFHLVTLGMGRSSTVSRGENAGRTLTHDFVALEHLHVPTDQTTAEWTSASSRAEAVAAWVSLGSDPTPIQAVGGWL
jgi:hypothetical protein